MKLKDLKAKIDKLDKKHLDEDVAVGRGTTIHHVLFAKSMNYNKRDGLFTSRIFLIQTKSKMGEQE